MCGVLYAKLKNNIYKDFNIIFQNALDQMKYRGPDSEGVMIYNNNYFGHVRLSIIDLSTESNQPLTNEKGILIFNGEIYNFKDFDSNAKSDTQILLTYLNSFYKENNRLQGMYAIIYYNKLTDETIIIRDQFGEKPLYQYEDENIFIVSSTLKSIIYILKNYGITFEIEKKAINDYFLFGYVREPLTIYKNIFSIPSGSKTIYNFKNEKISLNFRPEEISHFTYLKDSFLATDVPCNLLLSSGIDSTYLLGNIVQNDLESNVYIYKSENINEDESLGAINNFNTILQSSKNKRLKYDIIENEKDDIELYQILLQLIEQPTSHGTQIVNILDGIKQKDNTAKLIISGLGGDEIYGGYNSFKYLNYYKYLKEIPLKWLKFFNKLNRFINYKLGQKKYWVLEYYYKYRIDLNCIELIIDESMEDNFQRFFDGLDFDNFENKSYVVQLKNCEIQDYMKNQLLRDMDNISMFYGMEARSPILCNYNYLGEVTDRKNFKKFIYENFNIKFGKKSQGFTKGENQDKLLNYFRNEIIRLNGIYNVVNSKLIFKLSDLEFVKVKKIYILLAWLDVNNISNSQLKFEVN
jgi:asparagine synthase (glutamine-hydrolysing)